MKTCPICGKIITNPQSIYCTVECRKVAYDKKDVEKSIKKFEGADPKSYVECKICGLRGANLTTHLINKHGINAEEYKKDYPEALICCENYTRKAAERVKGDKNPAAGHGGLYSPFSAKFIKGDVRKETLEKANASREKNNGYTSRIDYYTSRGMNQEEAEKALKERQTTFSKEICIEKYGEVEGTKRWLERQFKWFNSLSNSDEKIEIPDKYVKVIIEKYEEFDEYWWEVKRKSDITYNEFKNEIDPDNLRNLENYEMDHKYSRFEGFLNNVDSDVISCKHNLHVISRDENLKKSANSLISLEELQKLYNNF